MQKQYTQKAKKALELATRLSQKMHHNYIGTEHILLGLIQEKTGVAAQVLLENKVDAEKLLDLIQELIAPEGGVLILDEDGYSPRTANVLENAAKEAERFRSEKIGTEHLLLAILKESESAAVRLLNTMGINLQKLYIDLLVAMGEEGSFSKEELH